MNRLRALLILFPFLIFSIEMMSQTCCDSDAQLTICYFPTAEFCGGENCEYNLDSDFMEGIWKKINNAENFGPNGILNCEIETKPLGNIMSAAEIEAQNCEVIFIGNFFTVNNITSTYLPIWITNAVLEWTVKCTQNLTILFQGESRRWGYIISEGNVNPNAPNNGVTQPNIFDGPFGSLNSFEQGGTFQAVFESVPSTGATTLAQDLGGRPTIVLDHATNDIILADVGILCNTAGDVSNSPNIENSNDVLACNIFALGCQIVTEELLSFEDAFLCQDQDYTLPNGTIVNQPGEYMSLLTSIGGCDSTITTTLEYYIQVPSTYTYVGCDQDGFSIEVGNTIYDQSNPIGSETVLTSFGCDSLVNIMLSFNANSEHQIDTTICPQDSFQYLGLTFSSPIDTLLIIPNAINCDSLISFSVKNFNFENITIGESAIKIINNQSYTFQNSIPPTYDIQWIPSSGLSCDNCPNPTLTNQEDIEQYELIISSGDGCSISHYFDMTYICTPYIPSIFNPDSFSGNDTFGALTSCELNEYSIHIFDRWGSLVFQTEDQTQLWDGRLKNKELVPGIYVYQCSFSNNGIVEKRFGQLTLVR